MAEGYLMGLDNGGTVIKAALFDLSGEEIAVAGRKTEMLTPKPGYTERDMESLWLANCACVREVLEKSGIRPSDVLGLAVCGHGKGLYPWGKHGTPAYRGIVSTDNRGWKYPEKWKADGTYSRFYPLLCQNIMACQQLSLLAWLKDHEPAVYEDTQWAFSVKDYIRFRLTGEAYCEATDISGSGLMNVRDAKFDRAMLEGFGIGEVYEKLAPIRYSSENCGRVTPEAAVLTGLPAGTPVAGGMFDIDACAIALDITTPESLCTIAGTWSINEYIRRAPVLDGTIAMNSLYAIPGFYLIEECSATSCGNLEWYLRNLMPRREGGGSLYELCNQEVSSVTPEETDLYFLPFLYGSNAHPLGKAAFVGMTEYHREPHMLRAIYEGVVYSHRTHIDRLLKSRPRPAEVRMAGGAVNSQVWVQMFADILNLPVEFFRVREPGALGSAIAASVAGGVYKDYPEATRHMVHSAGRAEPTPALVPVYQQKYEKYQAVRDALDTVWSRFTV